MLTSAVDAPTSQLGVNEQIPVFEKTTKAAVMQTREKAASTAMEKRAAFASGAETRGSQQVGEHCGGAWGISRLMTSCPTTRTRRLPLFRIAGGPVARE